MGKRYYCEYCDRSFVDDIQVRKKHMNGTLHLRNKKMHYMEYRDMKTLIAEEEVKEECYKFTRSGQCAFGENCFRSHFPRMHLQMLKNNLMEEERQKSMQLIAEMKTLDSWLQKRKSGISSFGHISVDPNVFSNPQVNTYVNYYNSLPPSLQGIEKFNFVDTEVSEWG